MSLKRKAFCYENEIRIFIVLKGGGGEFDEIKIGIQEDFKLPKTCK